MKPGGYTIYALMALILVLVPAPAAGLQNEGVQYIGIDEKLGSYVPPDIEFVDEAGKKILLGGLINKPTVLTLVYYHCPSICTPLLNGIAEVVDKVPSEPGKDYSIITISFDEFDTPATASERKKNILASMKKSFPEGSWTYLTGDKPSIERITDAVGFRFKREKDGFSHTASLIILSPQGKIVRYLYGITFLPFDLRMALIEAQEGRVGETARKVLLYCFNYDPKGRKYVFNILKVFGTVSLVFIIVVFSVLAFGGRRDSIAEADKKENKKE